MPFETFGFAANYSVELNPEQPGTGWGGEDRVVIRAGLNDAVVAEVTPTGRSPWLAVDASHTTNALLQLCATPNPDLICVYSDWYDPPVQLINVSDPSSRVGIESYQTTVAGSLELQLLLLVSNTGIVAVGSLGVVWRAEQLAWDDLIVLEINSDAIVCEGFVADFDRTSRFAIDPRTGAHVDGPSVHGASRSLSFLDLVRAGLASLFRRKPA